MEDPTRRWWTTPLYLGIVTRPPPPPSRQCNEDDWREKGASFKWNDEWRGGCGWPSKEDSFIRKWGLFSPVHTMATTNVDSRLRDLTCRRTCVMSWHDSLGSPLKLHFRSFKVCAGSCKRNVPCLNFPPFHYPLTLGSRYTANQP